MKSSRFTDEQIIGFLKQAESGMPVKELCRSGDMLLAPLQKGGITGGLRLNFKIGRAHV